MYAPLIPSCEIISFIFTQSADVAQSKKLVVCAYNCDFSHSNATISGKAECLISHLHLRGVFVPASSDMRGADSSLKGSLLQVASVLMASFSFKVQFISAIFLQWTIVLMS
jgi:hypothetical protein